jgi:hypothetical protein
MQDFEVTRHAEACAGFEDAFRRGFSDGLRQLEEGVAKDGDASSVFYVDVDALHVLDGEWLGHKREFYDAGLRAAVAKRRAGVPRLDSSQANEDSAHYFHERTFRWIVMLNPRTAP